ncbi:MAG: hypothetical protein KJZ60_00130, partial [Ignavibacteriaceae bacterium]|nr:hypothetical protein [Ignavibacteriaceae bacterium]
MKIFKKLVYPISYKTILILISIELILQSGCGSRIERISKPPDQFPVKQSTPDLPFIKLHMKNGD